MMQVPCQKKCLLHVLLINIVIFLPFRSPLYVSTVCHEDAKSNLKLYNCLKCIPSQHNNTSHNYPCQPLSKPTYSLFPGTHGVYLFPLDGVAPCTGIYGFITHNCLDFGVYSQTKYVTVVEDVVSLSNSHGIFVQVFAPSAVGHETHNKSITISRAVIAGTLYRDLCEQVFVNRSDENIKLSRAGEGPNIGKQGKVRLNQLPLSINADF